MIAAILPCYNSKSHVLDVIQNIGPAVERIYVIDDDCPQNTGHFVETNSQDSRVKVIYLEKNTGVGGAVKRGFCHAINDGCSIAIKIDSDGQMDPSYIPQLIAPLQEGNADYTKGNRFFRLDSLKGMPAIRIFGNAALSFLTKLSSGYWNIMDPTNGFLAINTSILKNCDLEKVDNRYFFETDLLFRANLVRAKVWDIPMPAIYGQEQSNLKVRTIAWPFLSKNIKNIFKRISYNYFLRDFSVASLNLASGLALLFGSMFYGLINYTHFSNLDIETPSGIQFITAIMFLTGFQLFLSFVNYDIANTPNECISGRLSGTRKAPTQNNIE